MACDFDKTLDPLRLNSDVPAVGTARHGAAGDGRGFLEKREALPVQRYCQITPEGALKCDDPLAVESADDRGDVVNRAAPRSLRQLRLETITCVLPCETHSAWGRCASFRTMPRRRIPKVLEAIAAANRIDTAYDGDEWSRAPRRRLLRPVRDRGPRLLGDNRHRGQLPRARRALPALSAHPLPPGRAYRSRRGRRARLLHRRRQAGAARRRGRQADAGHRRRRLRPHPR